MALPSQRSVVPASVQNEQDTDTWQLNPIAKVVVGVAKTTFDVCPRCWYTGRQAEVTFDGLALERTKQV